MSSSPDARRAHAAVDQAVTVIEDLIDRIDTDRITLLAVRRKLNQVLRGPLAKAHLYGAFVPDERG